ncbi:hypothetical protein F8R90_01385 [Nostoc sp. NZL]|nr:hypothetical protein [Nostoc sp. NZL]
MVPKEKTERCRFVFPKRRYCIFKKSYELTVKS